MHVYRLLLCSSLLILHFGCTGNNLFDNDISVTENRVVKGRVLLLDDTDYSGIYVWMEGFNQGIFTDVDGRFRFELPEPSAQPGGGLNGIFNLYFFCANFKLKQASFLMIDGSVAYSRGDVNANGEIYPDVVLSKLLEIRTTVDPDTLYNLREDTVVTTVYVENKTDSVRIRTYRGNPDALIVMPVNGDPQQAAVFPGRQSLWTEELITKPTQWTITYTFLERFFQPGIYRFIPILEVVQPDIPAALLNSLGNDVYGLSTDYLSLPFRRQPGRLTVISSSD